MEPAKRLVSEADAKVWLDTVVSAYAQQTGISLSSGAAAGAVGSVSGGAVTNSEEFLKGRADTTPGVADATALLAFVRLLSDPTAPPMLYHQPLREMKRVHYYFHDAHDPSFPTVRWASYGHIYSLENTAGACTKHRLHGPTTSIVSPPLVQLLPHPLLVPKPSQKLLITISAYNGIDGSAFIFRWRRDQAILLLMVINKAMLALTKPSIRVVTYYLVLLLYEWTPSLVRCCLEGLAEIPDDVDGDWLDQDPNVEGDEDGYPTAFEKVLDRAAVAVGAPILPVTFQLVPEMPSPPFIEKDVGSVIK
ncbi:hypothetical protein FRC04_007419 [Tulasnella sp. 424]|nr:hypothetical protein FRC04_007419 [Tulasnella sp. 424]